MAKNQTQFGFARLLAPHSKSRCRNTCSIYCPYILRTAFTVDSWIICLRSRSASRLGGEPSIWMDLRPYKLMTWTIPDDSVYEPEKVRPSNSSSSGSRGSDFLNFCPNRFSTHAPVISGAIITQLPIGPSPFHRLHPLKSTPQSCSRSGPVRSCKALLLPRKRVRSTFSSLLKNQEPGQAHSG
jgi:hypothetical protein